VRGIRGTPRLGRRARRHSRSSRAPHRIRAARHQRAQACRACRLTEVARKQIPPDGDQREAERQLSASAPTRPPRSFPLLLSLDAERYTNSPPLHYQKAGPYSRSAEQPQPSQLLSSSTSRARQSGPPRRRLRVVLLGRSTSRRAVESRWRLARPSSVVEMDERIRKANGIGSILGGAVDAPTHPNRKHKALAVCPLLDLPHPRSSIERSSEARGDLGAVVGPGTWPGGRPGTPGGATSGPAPARCVHRLALLMAALLDAEPPRWLLAVVGGPLTPRYEMAAGGFEKLSRATWRRRRVAPLPVRTAGLASPPPASAIVVDALGGRPRGASRGAAPTRTPDPVACLRPGAPCAQPG